MQGLNLARLNGLSRRRKPAEKFPWNRTEEPEPEKVQTRQVTEQLSSLKGELASAAPVEGRISVIISCLMIQN